MDVGWAKQAEQEPDLAGVLCRSEISFLMAFSSVASLWDLLAVGEEFAMVKRHPVRWEGQRQKNSTQASETCMEQANLVCRMTELAASLPHETIWLSGAFGTYFTRVVSA